MANYVEIALKARDEAKPPVDDLKLALDELARKVVTALAKVDDDEAKARLLALNAKLDQINRKVANPRITVQGADRAVADMAAVDVALDKVGSTSTQELGTAEKDAESAALEFNQMGAGMAAAALALAGPAAGAAASVSSIGAAGALAYPDLKKVYDVLTGTAKAPASGPIAEAVRQLRQFEQEYKQISSQSGVGKSLLGDLPAVLDAADKALHEAVPLAKAGATSFREITDAIGHAAGSKQFVDFLDETAKYAPGATHALIGLAGAVGSTLGKALEDLEPQAARDTDALTRLVNQISPVLVDATAAGSSGMHSLIQSWEEGYHAVGLLAGAVGSTGVDLHTLEQFASSAGHVLGITLGGPLTMLYDAVQKGKAVFDGGANSAKHLGDSAKTMGDEAGSAAGQVSSAAGHTATWIKDMDGAEDSAHSLAARVKDLTGALSDEGDATSGALGSIAQFHQQLMTTQQAMQASGDKAGYMTKQGIAAAQAFSQLYSDAKSASAGILQTTHSTSQAAGPLIAMRNEMEKIQQPTAAERELLRELNAEIARLRSKTIVIGVRTIDEGGTGQPLPTGGGPTGHPQGGMTSQAMSPAPHPGGGVQLEVLPGGGSELERLLVLIIRRYVRVKGGGGPDSVQRAFGRAA